jgi:hypothetical protein
MTAMPITKGFRQPVDGAGAQTTACSAAEVRPRLDGRHQAP